MSLLIFMPIIFYAHYLEPRRKAVAGFGQAILPVLDGEHSATISERLSGILRQTPLGGYESYLERDAYGAPDAQILILGDEADLLALEVQAPRGELMRRLQPLPDPPSIERQFGIPPHPAAL
jgi:hypothetical protein